ncbi:MAG: hypothetical protein K2O00_00350 [Muribaculaceae bacterium]|nr:hypothetical protein [Muribaculaceae bacterium]
MLRFLLKKFKQFSSITKCCIFLSLLIALITSAVVGIKAYYVVPMGDDLLYKYVLDDQTLWSNTITNEISNLGDAISSQYRQYFVTNGRTLVHILVQMMAGPWGPLCFSIFIGCLIGFSMTLLINYTIPSGKRFNPFVWFLISLFLLYVFQGHCILWTRLAAGINYLYPMVLTLAFLIIDRKYLNSGDVKANKWIYPFLGILGFITGWSHESYCIPLSGALFVRYCYILYKHKINTISLANWIMAVSLWIGSAILVFAPGNFIRVAGSPSIINTFAKGTDFLLNTWTFWCAVLFVAILALFNRPILHRFIKERSIDFIMVCISIIFGMMANTGSWSFVGVSFFSLILLLAGIGYLKLSYNYVVIALSLAGFIPLLIHQSRIIESMRLIRNVNTHFLEFYIRNPNKTLLVPTIEIPTNVKQYVYNWFNDGNTDEVMECLNLCYYNHLNKAILLNKNDYNAYMGKGLNNLAKEEKVPYQGEKYLWFRKNTINEGDTLILTHPPFGQWSGPIGWLRKLKRGGSDAAVKPEKEYIILTDSIMLKGEGTFSGIKKGHREIIDITIREKISNEENLDTCTNVQ